MAQSAENGEVTRRIFVRGMVQGVGMRPFLALLASEYGITGSVKNIGSNVEITARASEARMAAFVGAIRARKPEMAEIKDIEVSHIEAPAVGAEHRPSPPSGYFEIIPSVPGSVSMLPPDFPVCADCAREMNDPTNRRYRHPFISCAVCGQRCSILENAPYDRGNTSMVDFPMCPECAREYEDPKDRRYHAQTVSCKACGPQLIYEGAEGKCLRESALNTALLALRQGGIVAVKGVGGYHLACSPYDEAAVQKLRALKGRERKPFAVMFRDIGEIEKVCAVSPEEHALLFSPARPIVLLKTQSQAFAPSVSGDARLTGAFLPYTPLQMLLMEGCPALVMTSANKTGQPEIYEDAAALAMLGDEALSGVLYHTRRIVTRLDDSVARIICGERQVIRRSRGIAPRPVSMDWSHSSNAARLCNREPRPYQKNIVAYGSDLKSAFCLLRDGEAYMSPYFGDMEEREVQRAYLKTLAHMRGLFAFEPMLAACDLHQGYHASRIARECGLPLIEVQHHHAHIASVMAEHRLQGPVIGVAFDGTGWGADGTIWGGEFLLCQGGSYARRGHLTGVRLAGGDSVAVDARKAALCYCEAAGTANPDFEGSALLKAALGHGVGTFEYSGMGRLFDAAASLLDLCHTNGYEGQCAVALENAAHRAVESGIPPMEMDFAIRETNGSWDIDVSPIIHALGEARASHGLAAAAGFHSAVCRMTAEACRRIRDESGVNTVALSGGTFQNELILGGVMELLRESGFTTYTNNEVPCNDGGLALGQAYIAAIAGKE